MIAKIKLEWGLPEKQNKRLRYFEFRQKSNLLI